MNKLILVLALLCSSAYAGDYEDGRAAYSQGDYTAAIQTYMASGRQGNVLAQFMVGVMYDEGQGVTQNYAEAVKWYRLAAAQGYASAQSNLGLMYANGKGVTQDYAEAMKWYRLAAAQGNAFAQFNLSLQLAEETKQQRHLSLPTSGASIKSEIDKANTANGGKALLEERGVPVNAPSTISNMLEPNKPKPVSKFPAGAEGWICGGTCPQ